jgi:hypothetical protein
MKAEVYKLLPGERPQNRDDLWFCKLPIDMLCLDMTFGVCTSDPEDYCINCEYCHVDTKPNIDN